MAGQVTRRGGQPHKQEHAAGPTPVASSATSDTRPESDTRPNVAFTEAGSATVAALLHLVRLMGAELVLMRGSDITQFEQAVRGKISEFTSPTASQEARDAGLACARFLVEQVLTQVRAQAELKKTLASSQHPSAGVEAATVVHATSKLLN